MNIIIRKNTKLGFGYNAVEEGHIIPPKCPRIVGTIKTLRKKINNNEDYQNFIKDNPYHIKSWFVYEKGEWRLINCDHLGWRLLWYDDALCDPLCNMSKISVGVIDK